MAPPGLPLTNAMLRYPRRNPLSFLILLIPLSLMTYMFFQPNDGQKIPPAAFLADPAGGPSGTLLVSALFELPESKKALSSMHAALRRFLGQVVTDVYIYTTPELEVTILEARGGLPIHINTSFSSPFDIPPLSGDTRIEYAEMNAHGRSENLKSFETYAFQNAKPYFLSAALHVQNVQEQKDYRYAFWIDMDMLPNGHLFSMWPDEARLDEIWKRGARESGSREGELMFFPMITLPHATMKFWTEKLGPVFNTFSDGTFFGGRPEAIATWENAYYAYHAYYLSQHFFVGKATALINSLFFLYPERIITVWPTDPKAGMLGRCGIDSSVYYQWWLAGLRDREAMRRVWDANKWSWQRRDSCRLTNLLAMEWLLRRQFGEGWRPPVSSIDVPRYKADL